MGRRSFMIVPPVLDRYFGLHHPYVKKLEEKVEQTVFPYCKANNFAYVGRTKSVESLAEKIESGRFAGWSELDDLFACTMVLPTLKYEDEAIAFLKRVFHEVRLVRRGQMDKMPDVFRFDATRFVGSLRYIVGGEQPPEIFKMKFEVQLRSAFEHAWSVTTHALAYKAATVDWSHLRLAAQLKAAVEQLDSLILTFESTALGITRASWPETTAKAEIAGEFTNLVRDGKIPSEVAAKDWARFSDNFYALLGECSDWPRRTDEKLLFVRRALDLLVGEVTRFTLLTFPRSVSLHQLVLGILVERGWIRSPLRKFTPFVTHELETLFPAVKELKPCFLFEIQKGEPQIPPG
jgi:hypothetical protein